MEDETYYQELGWYSPTQLTQAAIEALPIDVGLSALLSQLAVIRSQNDFELEKEAAEYLQKFLRSRIPALDERHKRDQAKYN